MNAFINGDLRISQILLNATFSPEYLLLLNLLFFLQANPARASTPSKAYVDIHERLSTFFYLFAIALGEV